MIRNRFSPLALLLVSTVVLFLGSGCQTSLAPSYDQSLYEGINSANTDLMTLMATLSGGTSADDYDTRQASYSSLIGRVDALELQSNARPMPSSKALDRLNSLLDKNDKNVVAGAEPPSVGALRGISKALGVMHTVDKTQGLTATEVIAFKNNVVILMDQALTYESFLNR